MRQIVLDTETTGLEPSSGHRIIEIGCVELLDRRLSGTTFHHYLQPDREIDAGAIEVHGITNEFLQDKPRFTDIAEAFLDFIQGAELVIHNAPFDVGFINHEFSLLGQGTDVIDQQCRVLDSLTLARRLHPGQRNSLDALCRRYQIDNSQRELHGALLDAEILADVYLAMTGGQVSLSLEAATDAHSNAASAVLRPLAGDRVPLKVIHASAQERSAHEARLDAIERQHGQAAVWRQLFS